MPPEEVVEVGVTASQFDPDPRVTVGVRVTLLPQAPVRSIVKLCVAGFEPASLEKPSDVAVGVCKVQGGWSISVTVMVCGLPMVCLVTLSIAVMLTVPV